MTMEEMLAVQNIHDDLMDRIRRLESMLEWTVDTLAARSRATGDWSISMQPNWTLARQLICEAKERDE